LRKNRTGYHNHINSEEVTELISELALVCEDTSIVSILNRFGYRTGNGNTWTEKRVQHVHHTNAFLPVHHQISGCGSPCNKPLLRSVSVRWLSADSSCRKILPAKQIVKFAPWMIERPHLDLPSVRKEIRRVHDGRRTEWAVSEKQTGLFADSHEA
jgi:isopentenyldiphosphate isomerase